jgi:hypothetical protein
MKPENDRDPFRGMRPPRTPSDLRQRVLSAATDALAAEERRTVWDRIWESRAAGRTWATVTLGLLVAHAGLSLMTGTPGSPRDSRAAERRQVRKQLDLPVVEISPRAAALALGGSSRANREPRPDGSDPASRS